MFALKVVVFSFVVAQALGAVHKAQVHHAAPEHAGKEHTKLFDLKVKIGEEVLNFETGLPHEELTNLKEDLDKGDHVVLKVGDNPAELELPAKALSEMKEAAAGKANVAAADAKKMEALEHDPKNPKLAMTVVVKGRKDGKEDLKLPLHATLPHSAMGALAAEFGKEGVEVEVGVDELPMTKVNDPEFVEAFVDAVKALAPHDGDHGKVHGKAPSPPGSGATESEPASGASEDGVAEQLQRTHLEPAKGAGSEED